MRILLHRANSPAAFRRALESGWGAEVDVRDLGGKLVVSHDPPRRGAPAFAGFLRVYARLGRGLPLAVNVKSSGLARLFAALPAPLRFPEAFYFDMSVPDAAEYLKLGLRAFARSSEEERVLSFARSSSGVWLDSFSGRPSAAAARRFLAAGLEVCAVSPELHGRPCGAAWAALKVLPQDRLMLCTDEPRKAARYFNGRG